MTPKTAENFRALCTGWRESGSFVEEQWELAGEIRVAILLPPLSLSLSLCVCVLPLDFVKVVFARAPFGWNCSVNLLTLVQPEPHQSLDAKSKLGVRTHDQIDTIVINYQGRRAPK